MNDDRRPDHAGGDNRPDDAQGEAHYDDGAGAQWPQGELPSVSRGGGYDDGGVAPGSTTSSGSTASTGGADGFDGDAAGGDGSTAGGEWTPGALPSVRRGGSSADGSGGSDGVGDATSGASGDVAAGASGPSATQSVTQTAGDAASTAASTAGGLASGGTATLATALMRGLRNLGDRGKKVGTSVGAGLMAAGGRVAGATGGAITPTVGAGITAGGGGAMVTVILVLLGQLFFGGPGVERLDDDQLRCRDLVGEASGVSSASDIVAGDAEEMAKRIYGVLSYVGMSDENIAGILGNWTVESGIDPTGVETIFDEPYQIGPKKQAAESADFKISAIDSAYASRFPAINRAGIGLGQWTDVNPGPGGRNTMLREFADKVDGDWYNEEVQLAFMMSDDDPYRVDVFNDMVDNSLGDPRKAAQHFLVKWEGINDHSAGQRAQTASELYAKMGGWDEDAQLGKSVLDMANRSGKAATNKSVQEQLAECLNLTSSAAGGNGDAAEAFASLAWPHYDDSKGNDGTDIYRYVHDEVLPGDIYYASCDRGVATAVRWSGSDDTFPAGAVSVQETYVNGEGKDKWEKVSGDAQDESNLKPGDVLITNGHILMYLGPDAIEKVWGDDHTPDAVIGHSSLNDRSPALDTFGGVTGDSRHYVAYRLKSPESNSEFKDIKIPSSMKPGVATSLALTTPPG